VIVRKNAPWPKVRLVCGEVERIAGPASVPERLHGSGKWIELK
jgi:hypothetical protein